MISVMLLGVIDFFLHAHLASLLLLQWCTVVDHICDATQPALAPCEKLEAE